MAKRPKVKAAPFAPLSPVPVVEANGWKIYVHPLFLKQFESLVDDVEKLQAADPKGYRHKKKTKLLAAILKMGFEVIPADPGGAIFAQGNTMGPDYRHWRRGKFFEGRYRLFFRYLSAAKVIVLAWVNDDETLRTYDSKTDAYAVFKAMLNKKRPPDDWDELWQQAQAASARGQALIKRGKSKR
jgi:toxin YhaV